MVKGYSRIQILLHWVVAVLIVFQILAHAPMVEAWRAVRNGMEPVMSAMVWAHINVGIVVLLMVSWRVGLRFRRGVPEVPPGPVFVQRLGRLTHLALYFLMVTVPLSGLIAWFGGVVVAGKGHDLLGDVMLYLILLHVAGALYHQFLVRDGLLNRMRKPLD